MRRRRMTLVWAAVVLAGLAGLAPATTSRATTAPVAAGGGAPRVNVAAFRGQGALAFLWNDRAYLLDGGSGRLHVLPGAGALTDVSWAPDGRWLAYRDRPSPLDPSGLRVVRATGGDAHPIGGLPAPVASFTWLPAADVLVVRLTGTTPAALHPWLVTPTGQAHHRASPTTGGLLAPNGRTLAYAVTLPFRDPQTRSDALDTVATAGGRPARLVVARHGGIILAGWWPNGKGLLFWLDPFHSRSLAADGLGLYTLPLGGRPRLLTSALPRSLSFSPSGREVLLIGGSGRELWHAKTLTTCDVETALCHAVPRRPGTVALDPVWSPTGTTWAFVQAQDRGRRAGAFGFREGVS